MPNWCSNNVTIEADPDSELFRKLMNSVNDEKDLFNQFVPQPKFENDQEWYGWNIENWGTNGMPRHGMLCKQPMVLHLH